MLLLSECVKIPQVGIAEFLELYSNQQNRELGSRIWGWDRVGVREGLGYSGRFEMTQMCHNFFDFLFVTGEQFVSTIYYQEGRGV